MPTPDPNDSVLDNQIEIDLTDSENGENEMPEANSVCDGANLTVALTMMANAAASAGARRTNAADQLSSDSQRMWSIAMTSPTVMAAHGMRVAGESGSGRTRAETNNPGNTAAPGGTQ